MAGNSSDTTLRLENESEQKICWHDYSFGSLPLQQKELGGEGNIWILLLECAPPLVAGRLLLVKGHNTDNQQRSSVMRD